MSRTIFVHIGTHKTGTTSIQAFLRRNARLLVDYGVYVPSSGTVSPLSGHHRIPWEFWNDPRLPDENRNSLDRLVSEINESGCSRAVISAEGLGFLVDQPENLRQLDSTFIRFGWTPVYLVFFRRSDHYAMSLHRTLLALGVRVSFLWLSLNLLFSGRFRTNRVWTFYVDRERFLRKWMSAIEGELKVVDYDAATKSGLTAVLLRLIGAVELSGLPEERLGVTNSPTPIFHRFLSAPIRWRFPGGPPEL